MEDLGISHQFKNIYQGQKVLITGHTGFKGSWMAYWLTQLGANVIGYSIDVPSSPSHFELLALSKDITSIMGDINNITQLQEVINQEKPAIVFHLAAQALVRPSYEFPLETLTTNIIGTANVLEACRKADSVKAIVNVTSDKCYENFEDDRPFKETDRMGGYDPYSASKGAAELIANTFRNAYFNNKYFGKNHHTLLASVRAGNVIGGGDWAKDRLIPDIVKATNKQKLVSIRSPKATRPWQHVLEPISGYLLVGQKLLEQDISTAEGWNFGPLAQEALSVGEIVKLAQQYWPQVQYEIQEDSNQVHEAKLLRLDCEKANSQLNWYPVWKSNETLKHTINWYKNFYTHSKIQTAKDLATYCNNAAELGYEWAIKL